MRAFVANSAVSVPANAVHPKSSLFVTFMKMPTHLHGQMCCFARLSALTRSECTLVHRIKLLVPVFVNLLAHLEEVCMKVRVRLAISFLLIGVIGLVRSSNGQITTAAIHGNVTDQAGAVVPNADITALNTNNGISFPA